MRVRVCAAACLAVYVVVCVFVCVATAAGRFAAKRRAQGWLDARLSDTGHNRVVVLGHCGLAGRGVRGRARCVGCYAACVF